MAAQGFKIEGIEEVNRVLDALPKRVGGRFLKAILTKNARLLVNEARANASNADRTGETTRSIGVLQSRGTERNQVVRVGPRRGNGYKGHTAHLLEYGTAPHETKPGVEHPGTQPFPFMRPAVDSALPRVLAGIRRDLQAALKNNFQDVDFGND